MKYLHHDCGALAPVIHADLKPQNVLLNLGRDGKPRQVKVADFGISSTCAISSTLYITQSGRNRWGRALDTQMRGGKATGAKHLHVMIHIQRDRDMG
jgi:serine/threonine protein kinase